MAKGKHIEYVVRLKDLASTQLKKLGDNAKRAGQRASTAFKKAEKALKAFGVAATAAISGAFLVGLKKGVDRAREFEKAMAEVNTILGEGSLSIGQATQSVERLALELGKPAPELAAGMYQTLSAGVTDSQQAMILLEGATKAGIAGLSSTTEAVDLLTTKFNAYGETVTEQAVAATNDLIFKTIQLGKTTMPELSSSLGQILPTAAQLGVPFEDVAASLATLTLKGVSTSEAVTQLNAIFTAFLRKGEQAQKDFPEFANLMGANAIKSKGFRDAIVDLMNAMDGSEDSLQQLMGRTEGVKAVLSLTAGDAKVLDEQMRLIADSGGAAERAFGIMANTFDSKLKVAQEGITQGFAELGRAITDVVAKESDFEGMVEQAEAFKAAIAGLTPIVNALGLAVGTVMTGILTVFTAVQGSIFLIAKAMEAMGLIGEETMNNIEESTAGMVVALTASADMTQNFGRALIGMESNGNKATKAMADLHQKIKDGNSGLTAFEENMRIQSRQIVGYMERVKDGTMTEQSALRKIERAFDFYVQRAKEINIELPEQVKTWGEIVERGRLFEGVVKDAVGAVDDLTDSTEELGAAASLFPEFFSDEYFARIANGTAKMQTENALLMQQMEDGEAKQIEKLKFRAAMEEAAHFDKLARLGLEVDEVFRLDDEFKAARRKRLAEEIADVKAANAEKEREARISAMKAAVAAREEYKKLSPGMKASLANPILGAMQIGVEAARDAALKMREEFKDLFGAELSAQMGGDVAAIERYFTLTPQLELEMVSTQLEAAKEQVQEALGSGLISPEQAADLTGMIANVEEFALKELEAAAAAEAFRESLEGQNVALQGVRMGMQQFAEQIPEMDQMLADITQQSLNNFASGLTDAFMAIGDGSKSAKEAFKEFAASFIKQTAQMIIQALILKAIKLAIGGFADGGVAEGGVGDVTPLATGGVVRGGLGRALPVKGYATGGPIVSSPHLALIGEGKHNEAVVPLPDGRSIPVDLHGSGGTNVNFTISAVDARGVDELLVERQDTIRGLIRQAMTEDRLFRQTFARR